MTNREKAIVMAYTGTCMLTGDKFQIFHEYIEDIMGRPVMTHEIGYLENTIKEKAKDDFIALCEEQEPCEDCISRQAVDTNIPFLLHKESGCPLDECVKAYEKANEYLRSNSKLKG